jgi:hypothetical protein
MAWGLSQASAAEKEAYRREVIETLRASAKDLRSTTQRYQDCKTDGQNRVLSLERCTRHP